MSNPEGILDRDTLFRKLRAKPENKRCFDCPANNPTWSRSTNLDSWTQEQLKMMAIGGNGRARTFFKQHGWDEEGSDKITSKYQSRAAQLYRSMLEKEAAKLTLAAAAAAVQQPHGSKGEAGGDLADFHHVETEASPKEEPTPAPEKAAAPAVKTSTIGKRTVASAKKPAGKLGLGVKKLTTKVDEALYDQAPAQPVVAPVVAHQASDPLKTVSPSGAPSAPTASRFAYDTTVEEPSSSVQRGKDGHLTLNKKGGDDFFSNPMKVEKKSSGGGEMPSRPPAKAAPTSTAAQQKFAGAKAISSKDFQKDNAESEYEKQQRLNQFTGSKAISSADYFGGGEEGGKNNSDDMDLSASDIVNRLSIQAKQDLQSMGKWLGLS